jgi:hypothetical protein
LNYESGGRSSNLFGRAISDYAIAADRRRFRDDPVALANEQSDLATAEKMAAG